MTVSCIQTSQAPAAIGPYSQAVAANGLLFVSGQLGFDPKSGQLAGLSLSAQASQALANLKAVLEAGGCGLTDVAAVEVFLTDMGDFAEFNGIYDAFFQGHKPARAVVAVKALPREACVEIKCTAAIPRKPS